MPRKRSPEEQRAFVEESGLAHAALVIADAMGDVTQQELADRLGVSRVRVTQILGADSNLTVRTLARIADALGCELVIKFKGGKR